MNQRTPLYDAVKKYIDSQPVTFHMPGHKLGAGISGEFSSGMAAFDVTEIPGTDNLHFPEGAIAEAQQLAAKAFGAEESFFLVNGSTCGVHAMIFSACKPGDKLIVARDCHKSVIHALMLAKVTPVYPAQGYIPGFGIAAAVTPEAVREALGKNPDAVGVFLTRPNYYGICCDLKAIGEITHGFGKLLLVDEAHGAHLAFHPDLPAGAMAAGADLCVQSAHKTLNALTQSAYLHVQGERADREKLKFYLNILQTSSPSYILMTSLDLARAQMAQEGEAMLDRLLGLVGNFKNEVKSIQRLKILSEDVLPSGELDRTRLVIGVGGLGISGFEAEELLRSEWNIQVEMADFLNIVCIATPADKEENFRQLARGCVGLNEKFKNQAPLADIYPTGGIFHEQKIPLGDTPYCKARVVLWEDAAGEISLSMITPYPPGIPILCPGEKISGEIHQYVKQLLKSGSRVNGLGNKGEIRVAE